MSATASAPPPQAQPPTQLEPQSSRGELETTMMHRPQDQRTMSMDSSEKRYPPPPPTAHHHHHHYPPHYPPPPPSHHHHHSHPPPHHPPYHHPHPHHHHSPPPSHPHHHHHAQHHHHHHAPPHHPHHSPHHLQTAEVKTRPAASQGIQSVVTTSFSAEEREGGDYSRSYQQPRQAMQPSQQSTSPPTEHEHRYDNRVDHRYGGEEEQREDWNARARYHEQHPPIRGIPQSYHHPPAYPTSRTLSSPAGYYNGLMKRSYYHHSKGSTNEFAGAPHRPSTMPSDFVPPKRAKVTPSPTTKDKVITPRQYWEAEDYPPHPMSRSRSYPPWGYPPCQSVSPSASPSYERATTKVADGDQAAPSPPTWAPTAPSTWTGRSSSSAWTPPRPRAIAPWGPPPPSGAVPATETYTRPTSQASGMESKATPSSPSSMGNAKESMGDQEDQTTTRRSLAMENGDSVLLLALTKDRVALSETLCVVRENIEVFTATQRDVDAPAPGRKHAVTVGQVGLRCIHCRHTTRASDRVKRAVCYPSSIKRIYRTVIDMKLDHFSQCKFVPKALRDHLHELKSVHTRSTGTTMQYFIRAAHTLGMEDASSGVRLGSQQTVPRSPSTATTSSSVSSKELNPGPALPFKRIDSSASSATQMSTDSLDTSATSQSVSSLTSQDKYYEGMVPLALPEDKASLSPLRCFLREQVCAFSATAEDIAVRAPTTFAISVGQVGIGCIHCVNKAAKNRSNRAVCFPFSIGRIYQSVADIQRFHLGECPHIPGDIKAKFLELQNASSKGSKGLATRQYWVTSAKKLGLVDTARGLRFGRDPTKKPESSKAFSLDILAQVAFSVTTANKKLVMSEDKPFIADFLYTVMEQLQPCRFTDADRNKRRLKDVGCIGVECKHCAGQVDGRKFFWSSVSAVESNFVSVHTHMLECRMVSDDLKKRLHELKMLRKEQTAALPTGSQKAFFARVWKRLHDEESSGKIPNTKAESREAVDEVSGEAPSPHEEAREQPEAETRLTRDTRDAACDMDLSETNDTTAMVSV